MTKAELLALALVKEGPYNRLERGACGGHGGTHAHMGARRESVSSALCAPVLGHHSFSELYLETDTIEVEGEVIEFQYRNPHSWIHVMGQETVRGSRSPTRPSGPACRVSSATASPRAR